MDRFERRDLKGSWKPLGINKAVLSREPFPPNADTTVSCPVCSWIGCYKEAKIALWIDLKVRTSPELGGDGRNYYCPKCRTPLAMTRGVNAELI